MLSDASPETQYVSNKIAIRPFAAYIPHMLNLEKNREAAKPSPTKDFRLYLQEELVRRCKKNSRFSVRAFARLLGVENSALSKILAGKRKLTPPMIFRLGKKLGLGPQEISQFVIQPHLENVDTEDASFHQLTLDQFALISDWYHYAIHELVKIKECESNSRWIAKKLGITDAESSIAIERLLRLGYLEKSKAGKLINKSGPLTTMGNQFTDVAFRKLQKQILEKALSALEETPMEKRSQTSMTMAISTTRLPDAINKIKKFRRELSQFLEDDQNNLDAVYHLGISLYPVTK